MDVGPFLRVRPAPAAVLQRANQTPTGVRFWVGAPASPEPVTWQRFAMEMRAAAHLLIQSGAAAGEIAAVFGANSLSWASCALGVQLAGLTMMPIYPASTGEQAAYQLRHSNTRFVFVAGREQATRIASLALPLVVVTMDRAAWGARPSAAGALGAAASTSAQQWIDWQTIWTQHSADDARTPDLVDARFADVDVHDRGLLLYTSGTSGPPKGVPLTHHNVGINSADWLVNHQTLIDEGDVDLLWLPFSHIFGFGELCLGNTLGWQSTLCSPSDAMALLPSVRPHVFMSVPAYWEKIAQAMRTHIATGLSPKAALATAAGDRLRFGLSGGAGLSMAVKEALRDARLVVIEGYGLTETAPTLTLNHPSAYRFDSVGRPLPSVQLRLADDGEILAQGPNVFAGYLHDPESTRAAFTEDGWFKTGDIGRFTDDGFLQIVDRKKDILVTAGGKNVPPANIEQQFASVPGVERVVVYGDGRPYLVAGIWLLPDVPVNARAACAAAAIEATNAKLARYETIKKFFIADEPLTVESGLVTTSLKVKRKAVYEHFRKRFEDLYV